MDVPRSRAVSSGASSGAGVDIPGASTSQASSSRLAPSARARRERERSGRPKDKHALALRSIRDFLRGRSSYDVLPVSFRLIVLDTKLVVKPALEVMWQAGVVSAPLWQSTPHEMLGSSTSQSESHSQPEEAQPSDTTQQSPADGEHVSPKTAQSSLPSDTKPAAPAITSSHQLSGFAGMLTVNDIIHLIQYYYRHSSYDSASADVEKFRLERLRDIEQALNVPPPPLLSVHPLRPLFDACQLLIKTHARRLPLLDYDEQTGMETVVSVLTQYRVLKFIAMNCRETAALERSLRTLGIGTFCQSYRAGKAGGGSHRGSDASEPGLVKSDPRDLSMSELNAAAANAEEPDGPAKESDASNAFKGATGGGDGDPTNSNPFAPIATATLDTTVFDVVHMFSERGISAVPILDEEGNVVDLYETVDVITLVRTGAYTSLDLTIRQALERRPPDFAGVWTCSPEDSLASIFALLRKRRVHRLLVLEPEPMVLKKQDFTDKTAPLEELDSYVDDLVQEEKEREKREKQEFVDDSRAPLEERLEKGDPTRRSRGRLVGIVCLSDILRYVIGEQVKDEGMRSRGTSVASSLGGATDAGGQTGSAADASASSAAAVATTANVVSPTTTLDATQTILEDQPLEL
ncbi:snf1p protein kinase activator; Snf4p [Pseudozyma hubeiensis SY62]|uniref:Snf1p protein kinase activator Snf4p n=1 Tax=Pseudozyma hubeiensis (strain SY62) TaxID=1305764 RepID=R9P6N8_PSEHS|nr:snf1p protein kinase activator; Snf4p [Pseudozyma hubeiensis SY62]GAC96892.1 snf1p protein kinase activator; Snf4p [Pseudozyma hubeiensis SY62]